MPTAGTLPTGWSAPQTAIVIAAVIAIFGTLVAAAITYSLNQLAARKERRSKAFADALVAVEDYAEMPYRVRRRRDTPEARYDITDEISRVQSRLAYHQALLQLDVPEVAVAYVALVRATKIQAGGQMQEAWKQPVLATDSEMSLGMRYPRDDIDAARATVVMAMRRVLKNHRTQFEPVSTANSDLGVAAAPSARRLAEDSAARPPHRE